MRPLNILIFILFVFSGMLILSFVIPKDGFALTNTWTVYFPSVDEILEPSDKKYADISDIIAENQVLDTLGDESGTLETAYLKDSTIVYYQPLDIKPGEVTRKIEFPKRDKSVLYPFFKSLSKLANTNKLIRILHYGDSQIEADRMTSYIRRRIQAQFGGSGPGLIPAIQPYGFLSPAVCEYSGDWKRYAGFARRDSMVHHNRYGVLASFSRFSPLPVVDTMFSDSLQITDTIPKPKIEYTASLIIKHSPYSAANVNRYTRARLFYGFNKQPFSLKLYDGEELVSENMLNASKNLQVKQWHFAKTPRYLHLEFKGEDSPDIYAMALDGTKGVAVDNIPLRGSGGLIFTNSSNQLLAAIYRRLDVKLIILQFGGNITPYVKENYDYYERSFYRQLTTLKRLIPGVSIVVVGLADMSKKDKDTYVSYPNIPIIRDALKKASFKAGCAFWDMFEAMGGENSMPSWVFSEPPLAEKDFVHFTIRGARIVAKMFYQALMLEYNDYIKKQIKKEKDDGGKVHKDEK